jgi:hypothetical protein
MKLVMTLHARNSELPYESGRSWRELYKLWRAGELPSCFRERTLTPEKSRNNYKTALSWSIEPPRMY